MPHEYINRQAQLVHGGSLQFLNGVAELDKINKITIKKRTVTDVSSIEFHEAQEDYQKSDSISGKRSYQSSVVLTQELDSLIKSKAKTTKKTRVVESRSFN